MGFRAAVSDGALKSYLEVHPTALDFMGTARVYLTIRITDTIIAHVTPRDFPLFANSETGLLLGRGVRSLGSVPLHVEPILAAKAAEVLDAFKGSSKKLRRRARMAAAPDHSFRDDVVNFLANNGCDLDSLVNDPRVCMDPETHCFELESKLAGEFWGWLAEGVSRGRASSQVKDDNASSDWIEEYMQCFRLGKALRCLQAQLGDFMTSGSSIKWYCEVCWVNHGSWSIAQG